VVNQVVTWLRSISLNIKSRSRTVCGLIGRYSGQSSRNLIAINLSEIKGFSQVVTWLRSILNKVQATAAEWQHQDSGNSDRSINFKSRLRTVCGLINRYSRSRTVCGLIDRSLIMNSDMRGGSSKRGVLEHTTI
jgi:hypothetical protein